MPCPQTLNGIARDCQSSMGGIRRVLMANFDDVSAVTVTDGMISAITLVSPAKFKEYLFRRNTGSLTSAYQVSDTGNNGVQSDLVMVFTRLETTKRLEVEALAHAEAVAIVEDCNGKFWYLGKDEPLTIADGTNAATGTARADLNGYNVALQDHSLELPYEVDATIIAGLLA
ncbi:MAG: hypothetical protein IJI97_06325 [Clostridia bacterium]|nr:hypothetical protein [Clostridia bacterium]